MTSASSFVGKAFEKYFYDFSMYDQLAMLALILFAHPTQVFHKYVSSKGQYVALRHVAFAATGLLALVNYNFPFNPPFPTIGKLLQHWCSFAMRPVCAITVPSPVQQRAFTCACAGMCPSGEMSTYWRLCVRSMMGMNTAPSLRD
eukprot:12274-Chlamydomonas_euryale.AAC.9